MSIVVMYDRTVPMKIDPKRPISPVGTPRDLLGLLRTL